jgi:hypothetical protein
MELRVIMLSEISLTQKEKCHWFSLICRSFCKEKFGHEHKWGTILWEIREGGGEEDYGKCDKGTL